MVNSKNVAFKVDKQTPARAAPPQPYATVINCRKPGGKRAFKVVEEVRSQQVPLTKISGSPHNSAKRKRSLADERGDREETDRANRTTPCSQDSGTTDSAPSSSQRPFPIQRPQLPKPTKLRRGKTLSKEVDLDCWFLIWTFSDPAQLLEMRSKIASCYRFLRDNPTLWKHSRSFYYGDQLPDPPSELTEFQYAHLRHGHGCMSCGTPSTRKTYWAFLRRWCKTCLQSKTIKEHDAAALFKDQNGEDISFLQKCLPCGQFDSWGNFTGVGPAINHSTKTVYLLADVQKIVAEYIRESQENSATWHAEMRAWIGAKVKVVEERRGFARKMECWEENMRSLKSTDYNNRKDARKRYFVEKASKLSPPITLPEMERCPAYRRAVAIPKDPNMTSWLQLKPKLEKEAADLRASGRLFDISFDHSSMQSTTGTSTPNTDIY